MQVYFQAVINGSGHRLHALSRPVADVSGLRIVGVMSMAAEMVEAEIRRVFPAHRPEAFGPLAEGDRDEHVRIRADLAAVTDWTTLSPEVTAGIDCNSGFGFLTKEAARSYLPAFLIADLRGSDLNTNLASHLSICDPSTQTDEVTAWQLEILRNYWDALAPDRAAAVCHYLEWRIARHSIEIERGAAFSLSAYWYLRT